MSRMSRDPRWTVSRWSGVDANGTPYKKGERIFYYPLNARVLCGEAAEKAARVFEAERQDEDGY